MSLRQFFSKFLFYHFDKLGLGRDYFINENMRRGSKYGQLLAPDNFWEWYRERKEKGYCYVSVSYYDRVINNGIVEFKPAYFDRIVYDLDIPLPKAKVQKLRSEDKGLFYKWLRVVKREAYRLTEHLAKRFNVEPIVIFTGNRGYQIHILLEDA